MLVEVGHAERPQPIQMAADAREVLFPERHRTLGKERAVTHLAVAEACRSLARGGHVVEGAVDAHVVVLVAAPAAVERHGDGRVVASDDRELDVVDVPGSDRAPEPGLVHLDAAGREELREAAADRLAAAVAGEREPCVVDGHQRAVLGQRLVRERKVLIEQAEAFLALAQRLLRLVPLRHVAHDRLDAAVLEELGAHLGDQDACRPCAGCGAR